MTEKQKKIAGFFIGLLAILFVLLITAFLGKPLMALTSDPDALKKFANSYGVLAEIVFVGMVAFQVVIALIPGEPLEIAAGVAFGSVNGTLLCLCGIFLGSMIVFFLVRRFGVKFVEVFFSVEKIQSFRFLQKRKRFDAFLFLVLMIPGTPKDLISYFVPLTKIKMGHWLVLTTFARIPSVVTSTVGGNALRDGRYFFAIILFAVTAVVSIAGAILFDKLLQYRRRKKEKR
ncbi:MAG: TVP38/TMEM64 family protein [Clostridia bacterium]|nr:TVP38/TMEM64 family protein [Clostridia bacterium]